MVRMVGRRSTAAAALLAAALLLATPGRAAAQDGTRAPAAPPAPAAPAPFDPARFAGEEWFGFHQQGVKIGWIRLSLARAEAAPGAVAPWEMTQEARVLVASVGDRAEILIDERRLYDAAPPHALLEVRRSVTQGTKVIAESARRGEKGFEVLAHGAAEGAPPRIVDAPRETLRDAVADRLLVVSGAAAGATVEAPHFDLESRREFTDRVTLVARRKAMLGGIEADVVDLEARQGKGGQVLKVLADAEGRSLEVEGEGGAIRFVRESAETAKDIRWGKDQFWEGMVRPDRPLGHPARVRSLKLRVRGMDGVDLPGDGRQSAVREADGALVVTIRRDVPAEDWPRAAEEDVRHALQPTAAYPSDHPEMVAAAAEAVGDAPTPLEKARRLVRWVSRHVRDEYTLGQATALDVLRTGRGDCSEHAMLYVGIARAAGLPTRRVGGVMYAGDAHGAFSAHAWAEVAIDGRWIPFDATWDQVVLDATHLRLEVEEVFSHSLLFRTKAKVEVLEVERR